MPDVLAIESPDLDGTKRLAAVVGKHLRPGLALLLTGPLGAGKTEFARAAIRAMSGHPELDVPSPSFSLVQTYETAAGRVHHLDLWRLGGAGGLAELGWSELREDIVLVEWPDRLGQWRPAEAITLEVEPRPDETRRFVLSGGPAGWIDSLGKVDTGGCPAEKRLPCD
jgi:tRNA threonylcarbamoyladenosine biosynthesis protein TsaE